MLHIDNLISDMEEEQKEIETAKTYEGIKNEKDTQEQKELETELEQKDKEQEEQKEESEE